MERIITELTAVFTTLGEITTKGHDTFAMADSRRILASVIDELRNLPAEPPEESEETEESEEAPEPEEGEEECQP